MEISYFLAILVMGAVIAIIGGVTVVRVVRYRLNTGSLDPVTVQKTLQLKDKYSRELEKQNYDIEKELRSWRGKYNQLRQAPEISVDDPKIEDPEAFVEANLPEFCRQLPKDVGNLLMQNKEFVKQYVKANPAVLQKFLKTSVNHGGNEEEQGVTQSPEQVIQNRRV